MSKHAREGPVVESVPKRSRIDSTVSGEGITNFNFGTRWFSDCVPHLTADKIKECALATFNALKKEGHVISHPRFPSKIPPASLFDASKKYESAIREGFSAFLTDGRLWNYVIRGEDEDSQENLREDWFRQIERLYEVDRNGMSTVEYQNWRIQRNRLLKFALTKWRGTYPENLRWLPFYVLAWNSLAGNYWNATFGYWLACQVYPNETWEIRRSNKHTTIYCANLKMVFDITYWGRNGRFERSLKLQLKRHLDAFTEEVEFETKDLTFDGPAAFDDSDAERFPLLLFAPRAEPLVSRFEVLPSDVSHHLLAFLSIEDVMQLQASSTQTRAHVRDFLHYAKHLTFEQVSSSTIRAASLCRRLCSLTLHSTKGWDQSWLGNLLHRNHRSLTYLNFSHTPADLVASYSTALKRCSELQHFVGPSCNITFDHGNTLTLMKTLAALPRLQKLSLEEFPDDYIKQLLRCTGLTALRIALRTDLVSSVRQILKGLPHLTSLQIDDPWDSPDGDVADTQERVDLKQLARFQTDAYKLPPLHGPALQTLIVTNAVEFQIRETDYLPELQDIYTLCDDDERVLHHHLNQSTCHRSIFPMKDLALYTAF